MEVDIDNLKVTGTRGTVAQNDLCISALNSIFIDKEFKFRNDSHLLQLIMKLNSVYEEDPLFILKLAIYCKLELNLQHFPNLLFAYASIRKKTKAELKVHLEKCIKSPEDVMEIVDICQIMSLIEFDTCKVNNDISIVNEYFAKNKKNLVEEYLNRIEQADQLENSDISIRARGRGRSRGMHRGRGREIKIIKQEASDPKQMKKTKKKYLKIGNLFPFPYPSKLKLSKELSTILRNALVSFNEEDYIKCNFEKRRMRRVHFRRKIVKRLALQYVKKEFKKGRLREKKSRIMSLRARGRGRGRGFSRGRFFMRTETDNLSENSNNEININFTRQKQHDLITRPLITIKKIIRYLKLDFDCFLLDKIKGCKYPLNENEFNNKYYKNCSNNSENLKFKEVNTGLRMCLKPVDNFSKYLKNTDFLINQISLLKNHPLDLIFNFFNLDSDTNPNYLFKDYISEDPLRILMNLKFSDTIIPYDILKVFKIINNSSKDNNHLNSEDLKSFNNLLSFLFRFTLNKKDLNSKHNNLKRLFLIDKSACMDLKSELYQLSYKELAILNSFHYPDNLTEVFFYGFEENENTPKGVMKFSFKKEEPFQSFNKQLIHFSQGINLDSTPLPFRLFDELIDSNQTYGEIFLFSECLIKKRENFFSNTKEFFTSLENYRKEICPSMKFYSINMMPNTCFIDEESTDNEIYIEGYNLNLPKFCLEYGNFLEKVNKYTN
jgi:hypothetical protein